MFICSTTTVIMNFRNRPIAGATPITAISLTVIHQNMTSRWERIANEILMYFRSRKKLQGEVSLSDSIETDQDGNDLMLMDVVGVDDTMLSDLQDREDSVLVRRLVRECLTDREREIVTLRYGLGGRMPRTQREIAKKLGISRSYVSRIEKRALEKLEEAIGERG